MYNSDKVLQGRLAVKAHADGVWDRLFKMAQDGNIQTEWLAAAMYQCNKADKALLDDETRYHNHTAPSI